MPRLVRGSSPSNRVTGTVAGSLAAVGCLLAVLERTLPVITIGSTGVNATRLAPLVILILLMPMSLALVHRRHPWPHWFRPVVLEVATGLGGYVVTYQLLHQGLPGFFRELTLPTMGLLIVMWCVGAAIAAVSITMAHAIRRPQLDWPQCPHCDYLLVGVDSDRCPECGEAVTPLADRDAG